jgi:glyceraldehyde-3-phosphate dehydrogenase (NADP+)
MSEIPENHRLDDPIEQRQYLRDGQIHTWDGPMQTVLSPICIPSEKGLVRHELGAFPLLTPEESLQALAAAVKAYDCGRGTWPTMGIEGRIRHVESFITRMVEKRGDVVRLLMWEIGKSLPDSEKEFDRTVIYLRDTIEALKDLDRASSRFSIEEGIIAQIRRAPLGVVLCMGPFNYPLNETFTTLIPALIMGNTVVFKPPKLGVLLFGPLLEAFRDSFPPGVINTVYGSGRTVVGPLMESGQIDALAFIGSDKVADQLKHQHPHPHRLRSVLGLGAKNAAIVLQHCDLDSAVEECVLGSLSFNGQRCTALKILFVHQDIVDDFLERFCLKVNALPLGLPWTPGVRITPLPEENKCEQMSSYLSNALSQGARIVNEGGGDFCESFFAPAVVYPVKAGMRLYQEEQFGPIVPVVSFSDVSEPLTYIQESNYGQQVSLFGKNPTVLSSLIDPLVNQVCRVNINSQCQRGPDVYPFTGRKDSAEGTLSVSDALRVFSIRTLVAAKGTPLNKTIIRAVLKDELSSFLSTDFIL